MAKTLYQLKKGEKGVIKAIHTDNATKERLESLGLIEGVEISNLRSSPLGCPRIYRALNTMIALRNDTAKQIAVEVKQHAG